MGSNHSKLDVPIPQNASEEDELPRRKAVKLLLTGTPEAGKRTIFKQLRILYGKEFSMAETMSYKRIITHNLLQSILMVLRNTPNLSNRDLDSQSFSGYCFLLGYEIQEADIEKFPAHLASAIVKLWRSSYIRTLFRTGDRINLNSSAVYWMENVERIAKEEYIPTISDIVRSRSTEPNVLYADYLFQDVHFQIHDFRAIQAAGGDPKIDVVIFCVALSEFDVMSQDNPKTNLLHRALGLFEAAINNPSLVDSTAIIVFTKFDIFKKKIAKTSLRVCFPNYEGDCSYQDASTYIQNQFTQMNRRPDKTEIFATFTCATDTDTVKDTISAIAEYIIQQKLTN